MRISRTFSFSLHSTLLCRQKVLFILSVRSEILLLQLMDEETKAQRGCVAELVTGGAWTPAQVALRGGARSHAPFSSQPASVGSRAGVAGGVAWLPCSQSPVHSLLKPELPTTRSVLVLSDV